MSLLAVSAEEPKYVGETQIQEISNQHSPSKDLPIRVAQDHGVQAQASGSQGSIGGPSDAPDNADVVPEQSGTYTRMENGGKERSLSEHSRHGDTPEPYHEFDSLQGALKKLPPLSIPANGPTVSRNGIQLIDECEDAQAQVSGVTIEFLAESQVVNVSNACSQEPEDAKVGEPSKHSQGAHDIQIPGSMEKARLATTTNHVNSYDNFSAGKTSAINALTNGEKTQSSRMISAAGVLEVNSERLRPTDLVSGTSVVQEADHVLLHSSLDESILDGKHNSSLVIDEDSKVVEDLGQLKQETKRSNLVGGAEGTLFCPSLNGSCLEGSGSSLDEVFCSPTAGEGLHTIPEQDQSSEVGWPNEHSSTAFVLTQEQDQSSEVGWPNEHSGIATVLVSNNLEGWHHFSPVDDNGITSPYGKGISHPEPRHLEFWEHLLDDEVNIRNEADVKDIPLLVEGLETCLLENHVGFPSPGNPFIEGPDTRSNFSRSLDTGMVPDIAALTHAKQMSMYHHLGSEPDRNDPLQLPSSVIGKDGEASTPSYQPNKTVARGRHPKGEESWEANFDLVFPCAQEITKSTSFPREGIGSAGLSFSHKGFDESGVAPESSKESYSATASPLSIVSHKLSPLMQKVAEKVRSTPVMANHVLTTARNTMMSPKVVIENSNKHISKNNKSIWAWLRCCGGKG